jgi:hypothetical protein
MADMFLSERAALEDGPAKDVDAEPLEVEAIPFGFVRVLAGSGALLVRLFDDDCLLCRTENGAVRNCEDVLWLFVEEEEAEAAWVGNGSGMAFAVLVDSPMDNFPLTESFVLDCFKSSVIISIKCI